MQEVAMCADCLLVLGVVGLTLGLFCAMLVAAMIYWRQYDWFISTAIFALLLIPLGLFASVGNSIIEKLVF